MKNPNLRQINVNINVDVYEWIRGQIMEGRYATISEAVREALFDLKHRRETTIRSYGE